MGSAKTICLIVVLACSLSAADWPQWRGPQRDGLSRESGLLREWPSQGPPPLWKVTGLGEGFSAFSVAGGRLFTQGQRARQEFVLALDAESGKKLWETPTGHGFRESRGNGPRGTPTVDGEVIYALSGDGTLACLEAATGKTLWMLNVVQKFGGSVPQWGYSESPLVYGSYVIVTPGGPGASVVALNKKTGEAVWKSQSDPAAYSSPIAAEMGGVRMIIAFTANGVMGLRATNGELLWRYDKVANNVANIATPIFHNGSLFVSSAYSTGGALLKLTAAGEKVKAEEVYFTREMQNHYCTSVLIGEHLYGFSNNILTAMNFQTGQVAWRNRSVGKGEVAFADGRLYLMSEDGVVGLADPSSAAYKEVSRFSIPRGQYNTWTPPVIANGKMYLREQDNLYCFDVRGK